MEKQFELGQEHGICYVYRQGCAEHLQEVQSLCTKLSHSQQKKTPCECTHRLSESRNLNIVNQCMIVLFISAVVIMQSNSPEAAPLLVQAQAASRHALLHPNAPYSSLAMKRKKAKDQPEDEDGELLFFSAATRGYPC